MEITESLAVSVSALDAQRRRMNVIASNLANAQSTRTADGGPYRRRDVVFQSTPVGSRFHQTFRKLAAGPAAHALEGVRVSRVIEDRKPGHQIYDPRHPDADAKGFVRLPNINVMEEMVNMIGASRSYEANVQAISATKAMWNRALEIGR
ncbi:MAG TPA: flagellar basal body rod protein FlgC [Nitrospira sp.]|nr:flagellar basal body rod protein FlgC [Nitrospira sp.]